MQNIILKSQPTNSIWTICIHYNTICKIQYKDVHTYDICNQNNKYITSTNFKKTDRSPHNAGIKLYNKLPNAIKMLENTKFKTELKTYLINKELNTLQEL